MYRVATKLFLLLLMTILGSGDGNSCEYKTSRGYLKAFCYDIKLEVIPANLKSDIQILDARENRIGRLFNQSLAPYADLRELYLQKCGMAVVESQVFALASRRLEILDLSYNYLRELPAASVFALPVLRKLYLEFNLFTDGLLDLRDKDEDEMEALEADYEKEIVAARLEELILSNNQFTRLPRFGSLPELQVLDVSKNNFTRLPRVDDLARLCSLRRLNLTNNPIDFAASGCDCYELRRWIQTHAIQLVNGPLRCPERLFCADVGFSNHTLGLYKTCQAAKQYRANRPYSMKVWMAGLLSILVIAGAGIFYYMRKRKDPEIGLQGLSVKSCT